MAILSEHVDEEPQHATGLLKSLRIPSEFSRYDALEDNVATARLDEWKADALAALKYLRGMLSIDDVVDSDIVYTCAGFQGDGEWTSEEMSALSSGKRSTLSAPKITQETPRNSRTMGRALLTSPGGSLYEMYQACIPNESSSHAEPRNWP